MRNDNSGGINDVLMAKTSQHNKVLTIIIIVIIVPLIIIITSINSISIILEWLVLLFTIV